MLLRKHAALYILRGYVSLRLKLILLILQAASQFSLPHSPPDSPHYPHSNNMMTCPQPPGTPHHPLCPRQRAPSYRLLSATTTILLVPAFRRTSATAVCPRYLSVIMSSMLLMASYSWQLLQARISHIERSSVPRRQPTMRWERLPLGMAVGPPGTACLKTCMRTLLYVLQRVSGEVPPRRRPNVGCLK